MDSRHSIRDKELIALRMEHRDLDYAIEQLQRDALFDQLQLRRLKKKKLVLKDTIAKLESAAIPDLPA
ncbi:MAG TPA: hypothetical protein DCY55_08355 [Gammaproteobacteria bacterium]|jgi:hypothetical protein|nr:DUF465 domain-containing protein [Pseudomonadota bacterium]HAY46283.1 hypothetical protein [Gammaproteobacteria bacterium]